MRQEASGKYFNLAAKRILFRIRVQITSNSREKISIANFTETAVNKEVENEKKLNKSPERIFVAKKNRLAQPVRHP
jgi:hypothetical protein